MGAEISVKRLAIIIQIQRYSILNVDLTSNLLWLLVW